MAKGEETVLTIDGRDVVISNPSKVFFSEHGETKIDLVHHYVAVAEPVMRTMGGRPTMLQRFPDGAEGSSFFQKRVPKSAPEWLETTIVSTPNGTTSNAMVVADLAHVAWAVNIGCLGFHPWPYHAADPEHTDELRLDLDPQPGNDFDDVRAAAKVVRAFLDELGVVGYPKTTGNRGVHVYIRLEPRWDSYDVRRAAVGIARELERRHPDLAHRGVVEGGTREARLPRLQPERATQDGVRRVVGAVARRCAGVDAVPLGRDRRRAPRRPHARNAPGSPRERR